MLITVTVPQGSLWLEASSIDLYHYPENPDPRAWRSRRIRLRLGPGEAVRLSVEPKSKGSTYVGGWTIEREANERIGVDADQALLFACRRP